MVRVCGFSPCRSQLGLERIDVVAVDRVHAPISERPHQPSRRLPATRLDLGIGAPEHRHVVAQRRALERAIGHVVRAFLEPVIGQCGERRQRRCPGLRTRDLDGVRVDRLAHRLACLLWRKCPLRSGTPAHRVAQPPALDSLARFGLLRCRPRCHERDPQPALAPWRSR